MHFVTRCMSLCAATSLLLFSRPTNGQDNTFWLHEASVQRINAAFDAGELTAEQLVQMYLGRIEAYDDQGPVLNSILMLNPSALETARALDVERQTSGPRSVLHGVPILLKDQLDTFDMPTTYGSLAPERFHTARRCVRRAETTRRRGDYSRQDES